MGGFNPLELKSYTDEVGYSDALDQAVRYGKQLELSEIFLIFFVEYIDGANREKYEKEYTDKESSVRVIPVFEISYCKRQKTMQPYGTAYIVHSPAGQFEHLERQD
ncbi:MAG: hypothetical protein GY749_06245 [Desulfobacteraceae bacterium]|nr:hypothetical protein [Desulfobacteraceae bacterium]